MNRRGLLRASASGLSLTLMGQLPALAVALKAAAAEKPIASLWGAVIPAAVIYDERYNSAWAYVAQAGGDGTALYPTRGDATRLWYGALENLLHKRGGAVAGLTTYPDFIIARSCGRELGLRLAFERNYGILAGEILGDGADEPSRASRLTAWLLKPRSGG